MLGRMPVFFDVAMGLGRMLMAPVASLPVTER
jgi:hypothetical protein